MPPSADGYPAYGNRVPQRQSHSNAVERRHFGNYMKAMGVPGPGSYLPIEDWTRKKGPAAGPGSNSNRYGSFGS